MQALNIDALFIWKAWVLNRENSKQLSLESWVCVIPLKREK